MLKTLRIVPLVILITSCTFIPKVVHDPDNRRCNLDTSQRILDFTTEGSHEFLHDCPDCLFLASLYSTASAIISGSVVIIGNTIHWIEKQAKCSDQHVEKK